MTATARGIEIWITGAGSVTAAGSSTHHLLRALESEESAVKSLADNDAVAGGSVAAIPVFAAARRLDRSAAMFAAAAEEAWCDSGLGQRPPDPCGAGLIEGSSLGPLAALLANHREAIAAGSGRRASPTDIVRFMPGAGGAVFAQAHGMEGTILQISTGSASSAVAIGEAYEKIAAGQASVMVAGGSECPLDFEIVERFVAAGIVRRPSSNAPCRPFDRTRDGTVLGEGAGALVLESAAHARARGARPRGVLRGYGFATEAYSMLQPEPGGVGVTRACARALEGVAEDEIGWIKAHGTATRRSDLAEVNGLHAVFGDRLRDIPIVALKPILGHCLGASGAVEAVAALLALEGGFVPATLATTEIDAELPPCTIALHRERSRANTALLLSQSFGGRSVALVLGRI